MSNSLLEVVITQAWQIGLLAAIVAIVTGMFARNRPHLAHAMWMLVLIKCIIPPVWGHSLGFFSQLQAIVSDQAKLLSENDGRFRTGPYEDMASRTKHASQSGIGRCWIGDEPRPAIGSGEDCGRAGDFERYGIL